MFLRQISDPHLAQYACVIGCQRTGEANALRTRLPAPVLQKVFAAGMWIVAAYTLARNLPGFPKI